MIAKILNASSIFVLLATLDVIWLRSLIFYMQKLRPREEQLIRK